MTRIIRTSESATADVVQAVQLHTHMGGGLSALAPSMRVLRCHRDGVVLTSGLPDEILAIIFKYFEDTLVPVGLMHRVC